MERKIARMPARPENAGESHGERISLSLIHNIEEVIYGKRDVIRLALVALFARGHLLLEDVPGVGKTSLARALARSLDCEFQRVQFTSDLLPSDVIGVSVYNTLKGEFEFRKGPIFTQILLADEINRATPKTQSGLLQAMNRAEVTLDRTTYPLPQPFMVIATQNPLEYHGTYPLPHSQLDRFLIRLRIGYPSITEEKRILRDGLTPAGADLLEPVVSEEEVLRIQQDVDSIHLEETVLGYIADIIRTTREHKDLAQGASPRAGLGLRHAAQANAFMEGREYVVPDDVKSMAIPVLAHRIIARGRIDSSISGSNPEAAILSEILESVRVPA